MSSFTIHPNSSQREPQPPPTLQLRQNSQKMSITQTFYLAHKARGKLSSEASRSDHNLRLLVGSYTILPSLKKQSFLIANSFNAGHANLLDTLMIHLSEAERDQEMWYNNMVRGNEESRESVRQWPESIPEEQEEYGSLAADYESDSDSSEEEDEDEEMEDLDVTSYALTREPSFKYYSTQETVIGVSEVDEDFDDEFDEDEEEEEGDDEGDEDGMFSLTRTTSHRPPSLCSDLSDDEDEDSNPPSPPQPTISHPPLSHKERAYFEQNGTTGLSEQRESLYEDDYFVPSRSPTLISTFWK